MEELATLAVANSSGRKLRYADLSPAKKLAAEVTAMAMARGAELTETTLQIYVGRLSTEPFDAAVAAIRKLRDQRRGTRETALPEIGAILAEIGEATHPHRRLRALVRKLAAAWSVDASEELLTAYTDTAGHRSEEDQERAYRELLRRPGVTRMPSPNQFLEACGTLRTGGAR